MNFKPKVVRIRPKADPSKKGFRCNAYHGQSITMGTCKGCGKYAVLRNDTCPQCTKSSHQ